MCIRDSARGGGGGDCGRHISHRRRRLRRPSGETDSRRRRPRRRPPPTRPQSCRCSAGSSPAWAAAAARVGVRAALRQRAVSRPAAAAPRRCRKSAAQGREQRPLDSTEVNPAATVRVPGNQRTGFRQPRFESPPAYGASRTRPAALRQLRIGSHTRSVDAAGAGIGQPGFDTLQPTQRRSERPGGQSELGCSDAARTHASCHGGERGQDLAQRVLASRVDRAV
eukprot:7382669-Prymnesium_polylepis.1